MHFYAQSLKLTPLCMAMEAIMKFHQMEVDLTLGKTQKVMTSREMDVTVEVMAC